MHASCSRTEGGEPSGAPRRGHRWSQDTEDGAGQAERKGKGPGRLPRREQTSPDADPEPGERTRKPLAGKPERGPAPRRRVRAVRILERFRLLSFVYWGLELDFSL